MQAVQRVCRYLQQLVGCHTQQSALTRANAEFTLRQQLLDNVTHTLLPPASLHPLVRSFYDQLKRGKDSMTDYAQQHSYQSFQQQWTTYATLLLHTPTFSTLCQQLKAAHADVLPALLSKPATEVAVDERKDGARMDNSVDVELEGEYVSEQQLSEWLKQYRQHYGNAASTVDVGSEWQRIRDGTHETIVAWKAQR